MFIFTVFWLLILFLFAACLLGFRPTVPTYHPYLCFFLVVVCLASLGYWAHGSPTAH